jgi:hypothetical protein
MSDLISRHMAVAACAIGPSDEWSKATRSGYERAALDCTMNILRIESELPHPLAALAMRERAASVTGITFDAQFAYKDELRSQYIIAERIRALPTTFTDAELLAAARLLPEVRALIEAASIVLGFNVLNLNTDEDECPPQYIGCVTGLHAALAPFIKGGER